MRPVVLTLLSALLYGLAFPPVGCAPLAWVALAPFLVATAEVSPGRAAGLGVIMGLAGAYGVTWWFPSMVASYFGQTLTTGWLVWFAFCGASVAVPLLLFATWTSWMAARGAAGPIVVGAGWAVFELVRSRLGMGNPWALIGYSQLDWPRVVQIADLAGPYGPGLVLAMVNALAAAAVAPRLRGRHPRRSLATIAAAVVATFAYGSWRLTAPVAEGDAIAVAVVQPAVPGAVRRTVAGGTIALARQVAETRAAVGRGARLVFWPENAIDFYLEETSPERDALRVGVGHLGADIVLGGPSYLHGEQGLRYRNSVFLLRRDTVVGRYDKMQLLPFAEGSYEAGTHPHALRTEAGVLVGAFVCFEAMYPELVRRLVTGGATVLANLSNDTWFGAAAASRVHLDMARLRAIESRRWLVRATTTGISAIVDPHGRVVMETAVNRPAVLEGTIHASRATTPYLRWGDLGAWLATLVVAGSTVVAYVGSRVVPHGG